MSKTDTGLEDIQVQDDEEFTDKRIKQRILNAREMLNDAEHELFSKRLLDPDVNYSELDALIAWGDLVRSYIRDLCILLNNDDIPKAKKYRDQVDLGSIALIPPDTNGYAFSKIAYEDINEKDLLMEFNDFDYQADLPKPKEKTFNGLLSLVDSEPIVEEHWIVTKNPSAAPPNQEAIDVATQVPIPRNIYERALIQSDQFLQDYGIGLDMEIEAYMGGNEPGL